MMRLTSFTRIVRIKAVPPDRVSRRSLSDRASLSDLLGAGPIVVKKGQVDTGDIVESLEPTGQEKSTSTSCGSGAALFIWMGEARPTRLSHSRIRFQLANVWLKSPRSRSGR
jgi:hypothetical protein